MPRRTVSSKNLLLRRAIRRLLFGMVLTASTLTSTMVMPPVRAADNSPVPPAAASASRDLGLAADLAPVRERSGWRVPRLILVTPAIHRELQQLQQVAPLARIVELSPDTSPQDIAAAEVAIGICTPEILQQASSLQWLQLLSAGVEKCVQLPQVRERRLLVTNMQRVFGASMAEHVMGMMLVLSRHLDYFLAQQQRAQWDTATGSEPLLEDLKGQTILIVGLGGIGTEVAMRAHAFGMRIIATRASGRTGPDYVSYVGLPTELLKLTGEADYVVNCTPLTAQTTGIFDKAFFAAMKPTARFISVGRGQSTVTAELIAALRERRIAGAALDVTDPEPLPADSPLWHLPNVIITPHISAATPASGKFASEVVLENLRRYVAGESMLSVVDIAHGY